MLLEETRHRSHLEVLQGESHSWAWVSTLIQDHPNAILVENDLNQIEYVNQNFCDLFNIFQKPEYFRSVDQSSLVDIF